MCQFCLFSHIYCLHQFKMACMHVFTHVATYHLVSSAFLRSSLLFLSFSRKVFTLFCSCLFSFFNERQLLHLSSESNICTSPPTSNSLASISSLRWSSVGPSCCEHCGTVSGGASSVAPFSSILRRARFGVSCGRPPKGTNAYEGHLYLKHFPGLP